MKIDEQIGRRLKLARKQLGISQLEASKRAKIPYCYIGFFERCEERRPKLSELSKLAEVYHKSIDWFFDEDEPKESVMLHCDIKIGNN